MTLRDVRWWLVGRGRGHILLSYDPGSSLTYETACGMAGNSGTKTGVRPKKICRKCRERLPNLTKSKEATQ
jgi:hypothetical protein